MIRKVKAMLDQGQECYLVSTQCIEAGVDIDFPTGVREYAPLSSIIQTAGRINRNGKRYGEFVIFMLKDTNVIRSFTVRTQVRELTGVKSERPAKSLM